jgi:hypothetical protein
MIKRLLFKGKSSAESDASQAGDNELFSIYDTSTGSVFKDSPLFSIKEGTADEEEASGHLSLPSVLVSSSFVPTLSAAQAPNYPPVPALPSQTTPKELLLPTQVTPPLATTATGRVPSSPPITSHISPSVTPPLTLSTPQPALHASNRLSAHDSLMITLPPEAAAHTSTRGRSNCSGAPTEFMGGNTVMPYPSTAAPYDIETSYHQDAAEEAIPSLPATKVATDHLSPSSIRKVALTTHTRVTPISSPIATGKTTTLANVQPQHEEPLKPDDESNPLEEKAADCLAYLCCLLIVLLAVAVGVALAVLRSMDKNVNVSVDDRSLPHGLVSYFGMFKVRVLFLRS